MLCSMRYGSKSFVDYSLQSGFVAFPTIAQLPVIVTSPRVELTVCVDGQAVRISCGDLTPIYSSSANLYRDASIIIRTIAQLPVIVISPGVEFTGCIDRQAVATCRGDLTPICGSTNSFWAISRGNRAIAQLSVIVESPDVELTGCVDRQAVVPSRGDLTPIFGNANSCW